MTTTNSNTTAAAKINGELHVLWSCELMYAFPDHNVYILTLPRFPHGGGREIHFPGPPLKSVISVDYAGCDGGAHTLPPSDYLLMKSNKLRLRTEVWPQTADVPDAVWITYRTERGEIGAWPRDPLGGY